MELLQLRYFCEVARRESVTKVAEELHAVKDRRKCPPSVMR